MGSKSSTPPTPDYTGLANQQFEEQEALNQQNTSANRPDQTTPWGSTDWNQSPDGSWSETQSLNPQEQANLTAQQTQQGTNIGAGKNLFNSAGLANGLNGAPTVQSGNYYDSNARNAVWDQFNSMQQPLMQQQTEQQLSQLQAQGLRPGDPAYDSALANLRSSQGATTNQAMDQAVLTGSQVGQANQGMDVQAQQAFDAQRTGNFNMYNSLMGAQQGQLNMPGFTGATPTSAPDLTGAANDSYGAALNGTNASNAANSQATGAVISAAAMAAMYY